MKKSTLFFASIAVIYILNACHGHSKANVLGIVEPTELNFSNLSFERIR